ncbi:MAG: 3-oxoadipate enol-lactonase [Pseudomonadota bacterium]
MLTVQTERAVLHVRDDGPKDGRAVFFANSLGTDLRIWDDMLTHLPDGLRIIRYDKPGHGLSDCPEGPYSIAGLADDVVTIATALNVPHFTLVGLSIGGLIGQQLALTRPDLVRALVLMDTAAKIGTAELWQSRLDDLQAGGLDSMADGIMERWFTAPFRGDPMAVAPWRNMLVRTPQQGYAACCAAIAAADFTDQIGELTLPIIAVGGAEDKSTPPDLVRATAELCNAPFHLIEAAGHVPCVEKPGETARIIAEFLETTHDV